MLSPKKCGPSEALSFLVEDYGGVEDGEKRVRWYKRKLGTLFYVIKFLPQFMDSAYHVPVWVPFLPKETLHRQAQWVCVLGGGVP